MIVPGTGQGHGQVNQLMRHRGRGLIQFYFQHGAPAEQRTIYLYFVLFCFLVFFFPFGCSSAPPAGGPQETALVATNIFCLKVNIRNVVSQLNIFVFWDSNKGHLLVCGTDDVRQSFFFHAAVTQTQTSLVFCVLVLVTHHITCPTPVIPHHFPEIYRFQISGGGNGWGAGGKRGEEGEMNWKENSVTSFDLLWRSSLFPPALWLPPPVSCACSALPTTCLQVWN